MNITIPENFTGLTGHISQDCQDWCRMSFENSQIARHNALLEVFALMLIVTMVWVLLRWGGENSYIEEKHMILIERFMPYLYFGIALGGVFLL